MVQRASELNPLLEMMKIGLLKGWVHRNQHIQFLFENTDYSMREIGEMYHLTHGRVSQLAKQFGWKQCPLIVCSEVSDDIHIDRIGTKELLCLLPNIEEPHAKHRKLGRPRGSKKVIEPLPIDDSPPIKTVPLINGHERIPIPTIDRTIVPRIYKVVQAKPVAPARTARKQGAATKLARKLTSELPVRRLRLPPIRRASGLPDNSSPHRIEELRQIDEYVAKHGVMHMPGSGDKEAIEAYDARFPYRFNFKTRKGTRRPVE